MLIYIFLIFLLLLLLLIYKKTTMTKNTYVNCCFFCLILLAGLRGLEVGTDLPMYVNYYSYITWDQVHRFEKGFQVLCCFLKTFSDNPHFFVIVTSILTNIGVAYVIKKKSIKPEMSIFIYLFLNYYFMTFNTIRQALAISFLLIAYIFFIDKKYIRAISLAILACTFHQTAVMIFFAIGAYQVYGSVLSQKLKILLILVGTIVLYKVAPIIIQNEISSNYTYYSGSHYAESNTVGSVLYVLLYAVFLIFLFWCRMLEKEKMKEFDFQIFMISVALITSLVSIKFEIISRFTSYFSVYLILALPQALTICQKYVRKHAIYFQMGIYAVLVAYFLVIAIYRPSWYSAIPYAFFNN